MKQIWTILLVLALAKASFGQLSGPLSGVLGPGIYHVVGTISINSGDSLRIMPGTTFMFDGPYPFNIYGRLLAEGTESDSVVFTTEQLDTNRWRGLRFEDATSSGSRLACCLIERGYATGGGLDNFGGGVCCCCSSPTFTNSTIATNTANDAGGGVCCWESSSPSFTHCALMGNSASNCGGGVFCDYYSSPNLTNCTVSGNSVLNHGGGLFCYFYSSPSLTNCTVSSNSASNSGGGLYCFWYSSPTFLNCTISGNSASNSGGGVCCNYYSSPTFNSTIIAFSGGEGICFDFGSSESQVKYCDVFGNSGGAFSGSYIPSGLGQIATTNANGDSCDIYTNIFLEPLLVDTASGDFHLGDYSPCIGAADPTNPPPFDMDGNPRPNPPGSLPDIGAYEHQRDVPLPVEMTTFQAIAGDGQVTVRWRTESELDNSHFVLCKRKAGEEAFNRLAQIPGHGTTTEPHDYEFVDRFVQNNITYEYRISDVDITGREAIHEQIISATPSRTIAPLDFALYANYPNPFNPTTTIRYDVKETGIVSLKVFDLLGREVATLVHDIVPAGSYSIVWDAGALPSGLYLCRMEAERFVETRKMVLLK